MPPAAIAKPELFERLAAGHAAGITVVTPHPRLVQALKAEFDAYQTAKGLAVWEDADILPLSSFVERCYDDALYADGGDKLPTLLTPAQERELWETAIRGSKWSDVLLDVRRTAEGAMGAWRRANEWRIAGALEKFEDTEDVRAFADWARAYAKRCRKDGFVDAGTLPDLGLTSPKTKILVAYAFDILAPQAQAVLGGGFLVCHPENKAAAPTRASFASPREELETAACWARARLEQGASQVGIVVLDLKQRRAEVARVFSRVLGSATPMNISIGEPLSAYPLVSFALSVLEFTTGGLEFERISRILRSPFLGGAETDMAARALMDARLRRDAPATLSLPRFISFLDKDSSVRGLMDSIYKITQDSPQSPHDWAVHFLAVLKAAGFPGDRGLDSAEYQTQVSFNEVLGEFAKLALVNSKLTPKAAFDNLRHLCNGTTFQPKSGEAPVQVLGLLESAGMNFDALWVSGLTDDAWPLRARPNPFLPLSLQRMAGIPEASAEGSLELDRRITEGWRHAAEEVVFSWPRRMEDRDLSPSPLIAGIEEKKLDVPSFPNWRDLIFSVREIHVQEDSKAPPLTAKTVRGGTRVLADQAACPFRAFARWRLGAEKLESPEQGPDAIDRGMLLHALMAKIWGAAKTFSRLTDGLVEKSARSAVLDLGLEGRFAELEVQRLIKLAREWLELESTRAHFEVVHVENKRAIAIGALELSGRIDRMDRLADGSHALIDYKTGARVTSKDWDGPRPEDPQLPLYAVTSEEKVSALAFAKLRAGDMKFSGFSERKDQLPDVKQAKSWEGLIAGWKKALGALAGGFASGEAQVDPKYAKNLKTCANCDLHPLCRVHEKLGAAADEEEGE